MTDSYVYGITALLPLAAGMVVSQVNPYHALVIRGILGAVAAMVYVVLGAADVALTEALVGTLLAITLYAVAVRSSLILRVGIVQDGEMEAEGDFRQLMDRLRMIFGKWHLRLEIVSYPDPQALDQALVDKDVHLTCTRRSPSEHEDDAEGFPFHTVTRVRRLYEILHSELLSSVTILTHVQPKHSGEKH